MQSGRGAGGPSSSSRKSPTPLPYEKVTLLGLILAANNTSIWMIFSFLPFMVQFFFPALSKAELGYYAGILGSAFSAGGLIGNIFWGIFSDRYGRRPALLCGLTGTALSSLAFGFSPSFTSAVGFRFLWGLLNGNIGVAKTYLAEISDDTNSAKGMALFGVIGGFGRTVGPIIGGFLSSPAELYPKVFHHTIFETYPYALPSLVICVNCVIVLVISYLYLSETLPANQRQSATAATTTASGYSLLTTSEDVDEEEDLVESDLLSPSRSDKAMNGKRHNPLPAIELRSFVQVSPLIPNGLIRDRDRDSNGNTSQPQELEEGLLSPEKQTSSLDHNSNSNSLNNNRENNSSKSNKKRITFNGVVEMKEIGSGKYLYSSLKVNQPEPPVSLSPIDSNNTNNSSNNNSNNSNSRRRSESDEEEGRGFNSSEDEDNTHHHHKHDSQSNSNGQKQIIIEGSDGDLSTSFKLRRIRYSNGSEDYFDDQNQLTIPTTRSVFTKISYLLKRKEILLSTLLYGTNALTLIAATEIFPLWIVTPRALGGFSFTADKIGISTFFCGILAVVLQITLYPKLVEWFGTLGTYKISTLAFAIGAFITPMISLVNEVRSPVIQWMGIVTAQLLLSTPPSFVLVTVFVFINNSCYSQHRATVNGIGQTFASLGRLVGPYCAARVFAWSETNRQSWPFNYYFAFYAIGLLTLFNWYLSIFLPRSIERRKREPAVDFMKQPLLASSRDSSKSNRDNVAFSPLHPAPAVNSKTGSSSSSSSSTGDQTQNGRQP